MALAVALPAQADHLTAHPQDLPHVGTGQLNPFGDFFISCEARSQLLLRAEHLPGPGAVLLGIEAYALSAGPVFYESLAITVSAVPPTTPRSLAFAVNLPQPVPIVQLVNHTQNWTATGWERFAATQFYVHDGVSNLTIDIQKDAAPAFGSGGCTGLFRPDLETMLVTFGSAGTGGNLATIANLQVIPIDVRLVWGSAPTSFLRSPIPASNHHGFALGSTLDHVVMATPLSIEVLVADLQFSPPITLPFAVGQWWVQAVVLGADLVTANGEAVFTLPIPLAPQFVGQQLAFQALVIDAVTSQFAFTNASDCFLAQ